MCLSVFVCVFLYPFIHPHVVGIFFISSVCLLSFECKAFASMFFYIFSSFCYREIAWNINSRWSRIYAKSIDMRLFKCFACMSSCHSVLHQAVTEHSTIYLFRNVSWNGNIHTSNAHYIFSILMCTMCTQSECRCGWYVSCSAKRQTKYQYDIGHKRFQFVFRTFHLCALVSCIELPTKTIVFRSHTMGYLRPTFFITHFYRTVHLVSGLVCAAESFNKIAVEY